jgi:hypothetical protein
MKRVNAYGLVALLVGVLAFTTTAYAWAEEDPSEEFEPGPVITLEE